MDGDELLAVFPAVPSSVPLARRWTREQLTRKGVDDVTAHEAALLVSELATNAVLHTRSARFTVCLDQADDIEIAVLDHDAGSVPRRRPADGADQGGQGLVLVQALSDAWGIAPAGEGKWVWSRRSATSDITQIQAATYALWGAQNSSVKRPDRSRKQRKVVVYS